MPVFPQSIADYIASLDDSDFVNGGHRTNFIPTGQGTAVLAQYVEAKSVEFYEYAEAVRVQVEQDADAAAAGSGTEASVEALRAGIAAFYTSIRRIYAANVPVVLADAPSIAWDMATGINFVVTLGAAGRALPNPTNQVAGKSGLLIVKQDGTGGRTIASYGSNFVWIGDPPYWPTTANKRTLVSYFVEANGAILLNYGGSQL